MAVGALLMVIFMNKWQHVQRSCWIWVLDRQVISIGAKMQDELSQWVMRDRSNIIRQETQACDVLLALSQSPTDYWLLVMQTPYVLCD